MVFERKFILLKTTHRINFQLQHLSISNKKLLLGIEVIIETIVKIK